MTFIIIPDVVSDKINRHLNEAIAIEPAAAADRDALYYQLLLFFDQHGYVPEFTLQKKATQ